MQHNPKYLIPFLIGTSLTIGMYLGKYLYEKPKVNPDTIQNSNKIMSILDLVKNKYVDTINEEKLIDETINNLLSKLDPHSAYIPPSKVDLARESIEGKFEGIGVRFIINKDTLGVTHVLPKSPSQKVGLERGDKIIQVDTLKLSKLKLSNKKVMDLLKGPSKSKVHLKIYRNGKIIDKTIIRGEVARKSISSAQMLTEHIGYILLTEFSFTSYKEFNLAVSKLLYQGMKKLILDLRGNGGGLLHIANQIIDEFLEDKKLIVYTEGAHQKREEIFATSNGKLHNIELAILINQYSASASEIVAGAIQDNDRGIIIGKRSFGKGLVQNPINLKDNSEIRLTTARYYTPTGRSIQKPYNNGFEEYYLENYDRFYNGELYEIDSSMFVDSLKFITPKGKIVYGGGGIMPDIFIPIDTVNYTNYLDKLNYKDVYNNFAFDFANQNRKKWIDFIDFQKKFKVSKSLEKEFQNYALKYHNIEINQENYSQSRKIILNKIKAYIARQLFNENAFFKILSNNDHEIIRAIKELK